MTDHRHRPLLVWAVGLAVLVAVAAGVIAALPVHTNVRSADPTPAVVEASPFDDPRVWSPAPLELSITTVGAAPVVLDLPQRPYGFAMDPSWFNGDGWTYAEEDTSWHADRPGGTLSLTGVFSYVPLHFESTEGPAELIITVNGRDFTADPSMQPNGSVDLLVAPGGESVTSTGRLAGGAVTIEASASGCRDYQVSVARILAAEGRVCAGEEAATVGFGTLLGAIGRQAGRVALLGLVVVGALLVSAPIGYGLLTLGNRSRPALIDAASTATGFSVLLAVIGFMNYWLPVKVVGLPVVFGLLGFAAWRIWKQRPAALANGPQTATMAIVVAVSLALFALSEGTGIGLLQTDIFEYQRLTQLFWNEGAIPSGSDFGSGLRLIDATGRSLLYGLGRLGAANALLAAHLVALALGGAAVAAVVGFFRRTWVAIAAGTIASFGGAMIGLYVEGYLSRGFMAAFVVVGWALGAVAVVDERERTQLLVAAGLAFGVAAAIVPIYLLPALALAVVLVGRSGSLRDRIAPVMPLALPMAAVALPNLLWLRRFDVAAVYAEGANPLTAIVFPYTTRATAVNAVLGTEAIHANPIRGPYATARVVLPGVVDWFQTALSDNAVALAVLGTMIALVVVFWKTRSAPDEALGPLIRWTWILTVGGFFLLLPTWESQSYLIVMYAWTLGPLLFATLVVRVVAEPMRKAGVVLVVGYALIALNLVSSVAEASLWYGPQTAKVDEELRYDVGLSLEAVRGWIGEAPPGTYAMATGRSDVFQTDDGRTLANLIEQELFDAGFHCVDCDYAHATRTLIVDPGASPPVDSADYVVGVGVDCGSTVELRASYVMICRRNGG